MRLRLPGDAVLRDLDLETYVRGVVLGELAVGAIDRAAALPMAAVQAVLARTYAAANLGRHSREGFDLCATTHCQLYRDDAVVRPDARALVASAATSTRGQILVFDGRPALTLFHADCGGRTSAADRIWGGTARPYLQPVDDQTCARDPSSAWRFPVGIEEARRALNRDTRTAAGDHLNAISVIERDESGRATLVSIHGDRSPLVRGEELRAVLSATFGPRSIRSPRFEVRREGGQLVFEGRGFGHGAGLCQRGALARLRAGAGVEGVLAAYFPGTRLTATSTEATTAARPATRRPMGH